MWLASRMFKALTVHVLSIRRYQPRVISLVLKLVIREKKVYGDAGGVGFKTPKLGGCE